MLAAERGLRRALGKLRAAYQEALRFAEGVPDWGAVIDLKEEYRSLKETLIKFALYHYGVKINQPPSQPNKQSTKPQHK